MARGSNQSVDTKYATLKVCDALALLDSGRIGSARDLLIQALSILPEIDDEIQKKADAEFKEKKRGFHA